MDESLTTVMTPNPSTAQTAGASGISILLGWGAMVLGAKWKIPPEVIGAGLTGVATVATTIWHRFFGPSVSVPKS